MDFNIAAATLWIGNSISDFVEKLCLLSSGKTFLVTFTAFPKKSRRSSGDPFLTPNCNFHFLPEILKTMYPEIPYSTQAGELKKSVVVGISGLTLINRPNVDNPEKR